jgi:hypothetical protein
MWRMLSSNQFTKHQLFEWLKLIKLSMAMVLGSVENERCFSTLNFVNNKLENKLTTYLDLVMRMYAHKHFTFQTFPFDVAIISWNVKKDHALGG